MGWWVLPASCQKLHSATGNCGLIEYAFVLILLLWYLNDQVKGHYTTWHLCGCRYIYRVAKTDILVCHVFPAAHLCGTAWLPQNRFSLNFILGTFIRICEGSSCSVKSDKSIGHFTGRQWRHKFVNDNLLKSSGNEKSFIKFQRKSKDTFLKKKYISFNENHAIKIITKYTADLDRQ